jgi:hypothetical protein
VQRYRQWFLRLVVLTSEILESQDAVKKQFAEELLAYTDEFNKASYSSIVSKEDVSKETGQRTPLAWFTVGKIAKTHLHYRGVLPTSTFVSINHLQVTHCFHISHSQLWHPTLILAFHLSVITA